MHNCLALLLFTAFLREFAAVPIDDSSIEPLTIPLNNIEPSSNSTHRPCSASRGNSINSGIIGQRYRWKNFYVYPDPEFNDRARQLINNALYNLQQVLPCVNFGMYRRNAQPSGDYIYIIKDTEYCSSVIGKQGGMQEMDLGSGCLTVGTIMHEMIHALGFDHEQSRPDRDDYVTIQYNNIQPGAEPNFEKLSSRQYSTFGVPYDQLSIMHYEGYDFSKNGRATIVAKNGGKVGGNDDLRDSDKQKLKKMYNC